MYLSGDQSVPHRNSCKTPLLREEFGQRFTDAIRPTSLFITGIWPHAVSRTFYLSEFHKTTALPSRPRAVVDEWDCRELVRHLVPASQMSLVPSPTWRD